MPALFLTAFMVSAAPAQAADQEIALRCVLREVLASLTCKPPSEFRFVGRRDEVYVFNTYYAAKFTEFYCQVFDRDVVVTSKAWQGNMGSARLSFAASCINASVNSPWQECQMPKTVQCCGAD